MERFVHLLSKAGRRRLIELMLVKRATKDVAGVLGVTPASISKYMAGMMHPSDETMRRGLEALTEEEMEEATKIIFQDLYNGMEEFLQWAASRSSLTQEITDKLIALGERYRKLASRKSRVVVR